MEIWEKVKQMDLGTFLIKWEVWQLNLLRYELVPISFLLVSLEAFIAFH
jgi:hypothetical protein